MQMLSRKMNTKIHNQTDTILDQSYGQDLPTEPLITTLRLSPLRCTGSGIIYHASTSGPLSPWFGPLFRLAPPVCLNISTADEFTTPSSRLTLLYTGTFPSWPRSQTTSAEPPSWLLLLRTLTQAVLCF
ncbi:hypothetical protein E1301_Tti018998 [Triplophysa tibetana]|uniref:Uncharacterized protein n=1 Tax=Triplophysa tibetana TaxID=1572043 RepID=A0A5A9PUD9_9TELE|nr:hypothetical protein E1301_Tti018998 [Triplophysa tibetana]